MVLEPHRSPGFVERVSERISSPSNGICAPTAGIAALRHQRVLVSLASLRIAHLVDRAGPQQQRSAAVIEAAALDQEGRQRDRIGDGVFVADDGGKARSIRARARGAAFRSL